MCLQFIYVRSRGIIGGNNTTQYRVMPISNAVILHVKLTFGFCTPELQTRGGVELMLHG